MLTVVNSFPETSLPWLCDESSWSSRWWAHSGFPEDSPPSRRSYLPTVSVWPLNCVLPRTATEFENLDRRAAALSIYVLCGLDCSYPFPEESCSVTIRASSSFTFTIRQEPRLLGCISFPEWEKAFGAAALRGSIRNPAPTSSSLVNFSLVLMELGCPWPRRFWKF